jgi:endonuclease YncB( thermonuclease family)
MRRQSLLKVQNALGDTSMFGWRKKSEGFDWHTYVRTTIKVRREVRRDRIDAARQAALDKAHAAGQAVAAGGKAAGAAAVQGAAAGAVHSAKGVSWFWHNLVRAFGAAFGPLGDWLMQATARVSKQIKLWDFAGPLGLIGGVAFASGVYRWSTTGWSAETAIPVGIGAGLMLLAVPALLTRGGIKLPKILPPSIKPHFVVAGVAALAIGAGAIAYARAGLPAGKGFGSLASLNLLTGGSPPIEGRAIVVSGDTLRLNGKLLRLAGIEAPDKQQSCMKPGNRRWRCGEAAVTALEKVTRSKTLKCTGSGAPDAAGRTNATCTADGKDIAADLVRAGHVFSTTSFVGGYSSDESVAKAAKAGVWNGASERPAAYRSKAWDAAKSASPDGCPIKGSVTSNGKVYVLPWATGYTRTTVRAPKGERWFCSEADAIAAGFKLADKG